MQSMKTTMMTGINIFHVFLIVLMFGSIYAKSRVIQEQIPSCVNGDWSECRAKLEAHLHNYSTEYKQLKSLSILLPSKVASKGYTELIEVLLSSGVPVNQCSAFNSIRNGTMLHFASEYGRIKTVRVLLRHGANVNATESFRGDTPLHKCAYRGSRKIAWLLLKNGANINDQNKSGNTPLHVAVYERHCDVVKFLLKHGADKSIKNERGTTVEQIDNWKYCN